MSLDLQSLRSKGSRQSHSVCQGMAGRELRGFLGALVCIDLTSGLLPIEIALLIPMRPRLNRQLNAELAEQTIDPTKLVRFCLPGARAFHPVEPVIRLRHPLYPTPVRRPRARSPLGRRASKLTSVRTMGTSHGEGLVSIAVDLRRCQVLRQLQRESRPLLHLALHLVLVVPQDAFTPGGSSQVATR